MCMALGFTGTALGIRGKEYEVTWLVGTMFTGAGTWCRVAWPIGMAFGSAIIDTGLVPATLDLESASITP